MKRIYIYCLLVLAMAACCQLHAQTRFMARNIYFHMEQEASQGYMTLLGKNKYGQQLWYFNASNDTSLGICVNYDDPSNYNTKYALFYDEDPWQDLMPGFSWCYEKYHYFVDGPAEHFFLLYGEAHAYYAIYQNDKWVVKRSEEGDYTVTAHPTVTASEPTLDAATGAYVQSISWNVNDITEAVCSNVEIQASYDGGQNWAKVNESSELSGTVTGVYISRAAEKVRYRALVYPKDHFKMVVTDDIPWISPDTPDFSLSPIHITSTLSIDNVRNNFANATDVYARTYSPTLTWTIPTAYSSVINNVSVQYCTKDMGSDWQELFQTTNVIGQKTVTVPVGIDSFLFRMVITPKEGLAQFPANSVSDTLTAVTNYEPAFSKIAIEGSVGANYDATANTYTPTLAYTMNTDLWQTRLGKAFVYYSTDEGATWTLAKTVDSPAQSGKILVTIPADGKKYQFRIGIASAVNNAITCGVEESSDVYAYTRTYVLDDDVDYTPEAVTAGEVKVLRSFASGSMGTICLPFSLSAEQIAEGFGANTQVYQYTSVSGTTMNFTKVAAIEAGKPYLVKTAEAKENLVFSNIDIAEDAQVQPSNVSTSYVFTGTFSPYLMATDKSELFLTASGVLKYPSTADGANRLHGYRGYFKLDGTDGKSLKISLDGEVTGIDAISLDGNTSVRVYNLNGQCVGNSLEGLPKGVYIVGNKKVVINK